MSKQEFFKTLTKEQQEYIEFLLDTAFANGYSSGQSDAQAVYVYNNY